MTYALEVNGLRKTYGDFALRDISFQVPCGSVVGLIGENGAGKSTTINAILGLIKKESGRVVLFGKEEDAFTPADRERIGVILDGSNFSEELSPKRLNKVLKDIYKSWDEDLFFSLTETMNLPQTKKIKTFSKGMKMKLSMAAAFSHHPRLLLLDEVTSGLDPVMRDGLLDMFLDFVQDEEHAVLLSSHITTDLEKIADYIVFIHEGTVVFAKAKDELLESYGMIQCGAEQLAELDRADVIACRKMDYGWQALTCDRKAAEKKNPNAMVTPVTINEIMLLYVKGEPL